MTIHGSVTGSWTCIPWKRNIDYYVYIVEQCEYYEPETQRKRCAY